MSTIIKAKEGCYLKNKYNSILTTEEYTGKRKFLVDGVVKTINITKDDFVEVRPINVDNNIFYISSTNYADAVTELIRQKYSIDEELALIANARIGKDQDQEDEFQRWRSLCKQAAKKIFQ